ncbi:hypothetical protein I4T84_004143 [Salmonella enterica subsp. enterica serovar Panama]|nr:hypothetical protein [Salmonella enterica subsp. enterica serovar Panama]EGS8491499.1 hypothetical protein [Salmonella enterica subsp. enterica serovar Panama]EHS4282418.1 hypothetical protein [Salmonella enterica]
MFEFINLKSYFSIDDELTIKEQMSKMSKMSKISSICFLFSLPFFSSYANAASVQNVTKGSVDLNFGAPGPTISLMLTPEPALQAGIITSGANLAKLSAISSTPITFAVRFDDTSTVTALADASIKGHNPNSNPLSVIFGNHLQYTSQLINGKQWAVKNGPNVNKIEDTIQSSMDQVASPDTYTIPVEVGMFVQ